VHKYWNPLHVTMRAMPHVGKLRRLRSGTLLPLPRERELAPILEGHLEGNATTGPHTEWGDSK
jgi:hypothetical protein